MQYVDPDTGALVPPVQPSTTFARDERYELVSPAHSYARDQNPTFYAAERMLAELERGAGALLFSSGMAAAMTVMQRLEPGDRIVAPKIMYWGLRSWLLRFASQWGLTVDLLLVSKRL